MIATSASGLTYSHRLQIVRERLIRRLAAALPLLTVIAGSSAAQEVDLSIYSTADGGGALVVVGDFDTPARVTPRLPFCPGGICPYSAVDPGFVTPSDDRLAEGLFALASGTIVGLVAIAVDDAASVKIGSTVIDAAGESASLGTASDLHVHPEWQVQAPQGEVGTYAVTFRLTTSATAYDDSQPYTLVLSNGAAASPTATALPSDTPTPPLSTPSPTATPTSEATPTAATCAGDCDGDRQVGVGELITGVNILLGAAAGDRCPAFDRDGDGAVAIAEIIQGVNAALDGCARKAAAGPRPIDDQR